MSFGEVLKKIRLENGDSIRKLAEKTDIVFTYIDKIERGKSPINKDNLEKFIKAYPLYKKQLEKAYLNEMLPESLRKDSFNLEKSVVDMVELPVFGKASAGNGYINLEQEIYFLPVKNGNFSDRSFLVEINGDSMYPTLEEGDYALVDPNNSSYLKNKIYVVTYNDETFIKRIIMDEKTGIIILKSDNHKYDDIIINNDMQEYLKIEGRVVQVIRNRYL